MAFWLNNIRKMVYAVAVFAAISIYLWVIGTYGTFDLQVIRLVQLYAFCAVIFLYLALLASPLYSVFPNIPFRVYHIKARQALGISAFFFGIVHGSLAFFVSLGGFSGLGFLTQKFLIGIILSATALLILGIMALTSHSFFVKKLGKNWKRLHRLVYLAGLLIVIHALMLGTHFIDISKNIPQIFFAALLILLLLEALRFDAYISSRFLLAPRFGLSLPLSIILLTAGALTVFYPQGKGPLSLGIHGQHVPAPSSSQKRYSVSFRYPETVIAGADTELRFKVYDAQNGEEISHFDYVSERLMHVIIVNNNLEYFDHIHPELEGSEFVVNARFPKDDLYRVYIDFQPQNSSEQNFAFTLPVGSLRPLPDPARQNQDPEKIVGDYKVALSQNEYSAQDVASGGESFVFSLTRAQDGSPVTSLAPYLGAFGHMVLINTDTYEYIHVHPVSPLPRGPVDEGGPNITFVPIAARGVLKPGVYRVFAQFNPDSSLFTADFTVRVQ